MGQILNWDRFGLFERLEFLGQVGFGSDFGFGTDLRCRPVKQTLFSDFGSVFCFGTYFGTVLSWKAYLLSYDGWTRTGLSGGAEFGAV